MDIEKKVCPDCNGSGVYQEYDEYDRYEVYTCGTCEGTGEIYKQSVTSEEVADAIDQMKKLSQAIENDMHWRSDKLMESINLAITALQQYKKPKPDCERAERLGEWCCGYGKSEYDDEPIDACKRCDQFSGYGED